MICSTPSQEKGQHVCSRRWCHLTPAQLLLMYRKKHIKQNVLLEMFRERVNVYVELSGGVTGLTVQRKKGPRGFKRQASLKNLVLITVLCKQCPVFLSYDTFFQMIQWGFFLILYLDLRGIYTNVTHPSFIHRWETSAAFVLNIEGGKEADWSLMCCLKRFHFVSVEVEDYKFENRNYLWVWSQREASWSDVYSFLLVDATTVATPVLWA